MSGPGEGESWYYTAGEQQAGPVAFDVVVARARDGLLNPRSDMVLGPGLAGWTRAGDVGGLFERKNPEPVPVGDAEVKPEAPAPAAADKVRMSAELVGIAWPGVNRRGYFLGAVVVPVLVQVLMVFGLKAAADMLGRQGILFAGFGLMAVATVVSLWAVLQRFANLGMTRWWFFGLFVPLLNLWLGYRCFACPPGYACFRKLDGLGWLLAVLYWLGAVVVVVLFVFMSVAVGSIIEDPARWREILERLQSTQVGAGG